MKTLVLLSGLVLLLTPISGGVSILRKPLSFGEPIPGAEIYVELEPDDEPIANTITDSAGYAYVELILEKPSVISIRIGIPKDINIYNFSKTKKMETSLWFNAVFVLPHTNKKIEKSFLIDFNKKPVPYAKGKPVNTYTTPPYKLSIGKSNKGEMLTISVTLGSKTGKNPL